MIGTETVTGVDVETGESEEWDRERLIQHLGSGGFSAELTDFNRVSVSETPGSGESRIADRDGEEPGGWASLTLVKRDRYVDSFGEELRETFDAAVAKAIELEQRYH